MANTDTPTAIAIAKDIENETIRGETTWYIARLWASREPENIDDIIETFDLTTAQVLELRANYLGVDY